MFANMFSPFHDFARRQLGISPKIVDAYLDHHATAAINGRTVVLSHDGRSVSGHAGVGHTAHATRWVNQFNERSEGII